MDEQLVWIAGSRRIAAEIKFLERVERCPNAAGCGVGPVLRFSELTKCCRRCRCRRASLSPRLPAMPDSGSSGKGQGKMPCSVGQVYPEIWWEVNGERLESGW